MADLLVPRGAVLFEAGGWFSQASETFGADGRGTPGGAPFQVRLESAVFPGLDPEEAGLRNLLADPAARLDAGVFRSRLELNDQGVPLRLGYGVLDRVTVGATVPLVRRRLDALLQVSAEGANVGRNPIRTPGVAQEVVAFRDQARTSLVALGNAVSAICAAEGEGASDCLSARAAEARVAGLLDGLDQAWESLDLFPLAGSPAGTALRARWSMALADLAAFGLEGPSALPLATESETARLRELLSDPVWGRDGFPVSPPEDPVFVLGDALLHVVVGLVGLHSPRQGAEAGGAGSRNSDAVAGLRVRSAVEGTLRLATGQVDSFSVVTPARPMAGHGGFGVRWVTDLLVGDRTGLLTDLGWSTLTEGEGRLLVWDPASAWTPESARVIARGAPGDQLRLSISPRYILVPGLSLGAGLHLVRTGEARWQRVDGPGTGPVERVIPGWSQQELSVDFRLAGWEDPVVGGLPFPLELHLRATRSVGGSAEAPVESRLEMQARLLRRR